MIKPEVEVLGHLLAMDSLRDCYSCDSPEFMNHLEQSIAILKAQSLQHGWCDHPDGAIWIGNTCRWCGMTKREIAAQRKDAR